jgi:hypothetical protein
MGLRFDKSADSRSTPGTSGCSGLVERNGFRLKKHEEDVTSPLRVDIEENALKIGAFPR